ncbi:MAG: SipW-dependent-type signal peptide-containing protein [Slackia sp.]|nr:SipW-dependent-type signal peptide-containing protein [Slackia sp.]
MESKMEGAKKRTGLVVALVLCVALAAAGGVMAWYNAQSQLTNTFSTGNIKPPTTDPDTGGPIDPQHPTDPQVPNLNGNIYEKNWVDKSVITPGSVVPKDPNIGLAPESDDAYVFVYVKNNLGTGTTFEIDAANWKPVDGHVADDANAGDNVYTGGLFMYTKGGSEPALLVSDKTAKDAGGKDVWTDPLFKEVAAADNANINGNGTIVVSAYMAAASNADENFAAADAKAAAIEWAKHPNGPTVK